MDLFVLKTWILAKLNCDERGASMVEYGLLLALIAVVCIAALGFLGLAIAGTLSSITGSL